MATRTPRKSHEEGEQETASFTDVMQSIGGQETQAMDALIEHLRDGFQGVHLHVDKVSAQIESVKEEIHGPHLAPTDEERPKVQRRRSLDAMQFALRRLASGDPRPSDDDSPQVLQDAINEVIALRQIMNDMMQASNNVYQNGLVSIRNMTAQ